MPLRLSRLLLVLAVIPCSAFAWHEGGHMTIAEIAWRKMTPVARAVAERLVKLGTDPRTDDFLAVSVWADDHKTKENGPWHYRDHFFRDDGKETNLKPDEENAVWALEKFSNVLGDTKESDENRAEALRFIVHIAGDLHQPLHCVARVTDELPKGDRGGNDFHLVSPPGFNPQPRNLHFLWDMGCGAFGRVERPMTPEGKNQVAAWADAAMAAYPENKHLHESRNLNFMKWTFEGLELCKKQVYNLKPDQMPNQDYLDMGRKLSMEQVALSGYRLGNLLNKLLK